MAKYRKLGRTSSQRKALLRNQVTMLLNKGKIVTTEAKAKEVQKIAEKMIALAIREKDNFDEVTVDAKVPVKDKDGKRVKEVVDGKKVTVYDTVDKKIKKEVEMYVKDNNDKLYAMGAPFLTKLFVKEAEQVPIKPIAASLIKHAASATARTRARPRLLTFPTSFSKRSHLSTRTVTAVTPVSLRSVSVRAMEQWKFFLSSSNL